METTLIDLSSMIALRNKLDVAANNVANIETTGFRAQQVSFQEYLAPIMGQEIGAKRERPVSLVHVTSAFTTTAAGAVQVTGNPLDFAIEGNAYFAIRTDQGVRYTRDGAFTLDGAGQLVTMAGQPVMADGGVVIVPLKAGEIKVDANGQISTRQGVLGRLRLVTFPERTSFQAEGGNLFRSDQPPDERKAGSVKILQGAVERSNVQAAFEMSRLAEITRSYEMAGKLLKDTQDVDGLNKLANVPE